MKVEKDFYTTQELADEPWFPVKSTLTIQKLIENGDLEAVNVSATGLKRYRIKKQSALDFVEGRNLNNIDGKSGK